MATIDFAERSEAKSMGWRTALGHHRFRRGEAEQESDPATTILVTNAGIKNRIQINRERRIADRHR
ncbi:MAG TPA: hypothetical protein VH867_08225 [Burkholderiales bacterium]